MKITRSPRKEHNFLIISNSVVRDKRLSFKARGILLEILSQPDGWTITAESLAAEGQEGISAVLSAFKELREIGYMRTEKLRDAKGQFVSTTQDFEESRLSYSTALDNPTSVNLISLEEPMKEVPKDSAKDRFSQALEDFDTFWKAYPRKIEKKSAQIALAKALKSASLESVLKGIENLNSQIKRDQTTEKFIPYPASWLNGERWNDETVDSAQSQAIIPTKIPPRMTSDEFIEPQGVKLSPERLKALRKALAGDSDEVEFP